MEATLLHELISTSPAQLLIASIWQGLLLTACVWAGLKLAAVVGLSLRASARFTLWLIVFLLVALLPAFALLRGLLAPHSLPTAAAAFSLHLSANWGFAFEALWAVSSLFCLATLLAGGMQMRTLLLRSALMPLGELDGRLQSILSRPGARPVELRLSDATDAPSVIGFFRPAVVMPRSLWSDLTTPEREQVVLHELAHLHRGDDWTNLVQKLLRALCPLNPALLWAERHLCREREQACDEAVLEVAGNPRAYATCLTRLAESRLVRRAASLAPGLWKRPSELAARVDNILHRRPTLGPLFSRGVLVASLLTFVGAALLLQRCPGLVAFTNPQQLAVASAAPDLQSGKVVLARYKNPANARFAQAGFHDAVFHPASDALPTVAVKHRATGKSHPRKPQAIHATPVRLVALNATQDNHQGFTLILFTVDVPQNARATYGILPLADVSALSLSDRWIAFQI